MQIEVRECRYASVAQGHEVIITMVGGHLRIPTNNYSDAKELCAKIAEAVEAHSPCKVESDH